MVENHASSGDPDGVFKNVFICTLSDRCFGRHDCGMRSGVFRKPAGSASDTILEREDETIRGQKKIENFTGRDGGTLVIALFFS